MISVINTYKAVAPLTEVLKAAEAMVAKVQRDGDPGILSYELFASQNTETVTGLFRYADARAWIGHHELIKDWSEFAELRAALVLSSIRFLAEIPPEVQTWLEQANFDCSIIEQCSPIARYVK